METQHPTAGWERLGERFYRKTQLYTAVFDQDLDLDKYTVVSAPYGGAVALYPDDQKLVAYRPGKASKPAIDIYSSAGKLLKSIGWEKGVIKGLGWSADERLLVVTQDGTVRCYYGLQGDFTQFSLGNGAEEYGVKECRFHDDGLVALLTNNALVSVSGYEEPRPRLLAKAPDGEVHAWTLIPPPYTLSRSVEVLLAIDKTVYVVDATECEDKFLDIGPFSFISVSPNGKFGALYTETGVAHVITADFQTRLSEHDAGSKIPPKYLEWCGNDAVVIAWEDEVHLVGPGGSSTTFFYEGRVHVLPEHDGVRLLTNDVCDFLQKVPAVTEEVFRFGTESPASILLDAVEQLDLSSPKADDDIQLIRPRLAEAVDSCVNAAGHEFSAYWQKQLLRAASFGKSVLDIYSSDDFVDMCETLRVLNAVRFYEVGIPLSYDQYARLTPEGLVARLLSRQEYLLALRIAGYLRSPTDKIYVHWASAKVKVGAEDDETICRLIVEKLSGKAGISFEAIARAAYDEGRAHLATDLLNHEPRAGRQVPLLLSMEEDELALDKAIESGDTDLVYYVLHTLRRKLPLAAFFRTINARPEATALVEASALASTQNDPDDIDDTTFLKDLYYQDDRRLDGAGIFVREALAQKSSRSASDKLALAARLLSDNAKEHTFEIGALKEQVTLLRLQDSLDRDLTDSFTGLSVGETLFKLTRLGYRGRAEKIASQFKVPDKVAWWIK
jgi:vacuolar protein sorting-associated protein 16